MSKDMLVKVEAQYPISGGAPILVSGGGGDRARTRREKVGRFVGGLAGGLGAVAGKHRSLGSLLQSIVSGYAQGKDLGGSAGKFFGGVSPEAQIRAQQREANRMAQAKKVAVERYGRFDKHGKWIKPVEVEDRQYDPYKFRPVMRNLRRGKGIAVEGARRAGKGLSHGLDYLEGSTDAQQHAEEFDRRAQSDPYAIAVRQADERRQRINQEYEDFLSPGGGLEQLLKPEDSVAVDSNIRGENVSRTPSGDVPILPQGVSTALPADLPLPGGEFRVEPGTTRTIGPDTSAFVKPPAMTTDVTSAYIPPTRVYGGGTPTQQNS